MGFKSEQVLFNLKQAAVNILNDEQWTHSNNW